MLNAELAFNEGENILYYGTGVSGTLAAGVLPIAGPGLASTTAPVSNSGTVGNAGTLTFWSRGDHVHPSDASRLATTGGTLTGALTIGTSTNNAMTVTPGATRSNAFVFSQTGTLTTANFQFTGHVAIGTDTSPVNCNVNGPAGSVRTFSMQTASAGRWQIQANATPEGGSNTGSDFALVPLNDGGTLQPAVVTILRSSGNSTFTGAMTVGTAANDALTITPGAAATNAVVFSETGSGGYSFAGAAGVNVVGNFSVGGAVSGTGFTNLMAPYAPLASPIFTGTVSLPIANASGLVTFNAGESFGSINAPGGISDLSRHIALYSTTYGFNVFNNNLDYIVPSGALHEFVVAGASIMTIGLGTVNLAATVTLNVPGVVSGAGFTTLFASPPPIGSTTANIGTFTNVTATGTASFGGNVNLNSHNIINLLDPVNPQDAATRNYVDLTAQGLSGKPACLVATTGTNITLSGTQTIDGIVLVVGNRVLVKDQTTASANGIYVVAAGAWARPTDTDSWTELVSAYVFVEEGTTNADTGWLCTVDPGGTLGTTGISWIQFSSAGVVTPGDGLYKVGNALYVKGTTNRIYVSSTGVDIDANYAGQSSIVNLGTVTSGAWAATTIPVNRGGTGATTLTGFVSASGTNAFTASTTIPNTSITGLGTMATQNANNVLITGGSIDGIVFDGGTF
jgi:hypothetical protein